MDILMTTTVIKTAKIKWMSRKWSEWGLWCTITSWHCRKCWLSWQQSNAN